MIGIGLVAISFYMMVNNHFLGVIVGRTVGPYTSTLADYGFASSDPEIWQHMAARHDVSVLIEPPDSDPVAFDNDGRRVSPAALDRSQIRASRRGPDGTKVTFYWSVWSLRDTHHTLVGGLLLMVAMVIGSAFWFLQRQLKPLTWLRNGVDAVAQGDFKTRVPVVRNDEIGQVAEAFNSMASRVGEMIDDRERLLADVSHELRSPIARMKVALEFMPEGDKRRSLDRDLKEMENLIAVLLEREGLRSRAGRLEGQAVDLNTLVAEVAAAFADRGPGVDFASSGAATIHADPVLIKLLIQNLLDNAIKFSRPDSRPVEVRLEAGADEVVLRISDDGIGISDENSERLFEPFVKLDRARGHRMGYGIGLNLCQRIVQLHGGTIDLRPRAPRGTEAVVTLRRHGSG